VVGCEVGEETQALVLRGFVHASEDARDEGLGLSGRWGSGSGGGGVGFSGFGGPKEEEE